MTSHLLRLWVIGSYEMPRCDWLQHCNFLAGIEILPIALQTACKLCGFAAGRPAIVAGPVLRVAIGESCSVCRDPKPSSATGSTPCHNAVFNALETTYVTRVNVTVCQTAAVNLKLASYRTEHHVTQLAIEASCTHSLFPK